MRVLIVDDEQAFAEPLAQRLELRGIEAAVAGDAETALGMLSRQEWDLVFLDVCLPGMDGVSLLKLLQEHEPRPDVVMLSGATEMSQAVKAMRRGALNWLAKPVSLDAVLEECRKARERAESRRQARRLAEEARLRSLGRIAEGVAHEVNNPLNIIVQAAGLMGDSLDSPEAEALPDIEDLRESLKAIVTQSMRVREITRKLLMAGVGLDPRSAPMDVQAVVSRVLTLLQGRMDSLKVTCRLHFPPEWNEDAPRPLGSALELEQICLHLVENALDAMPEGGTLDIGARLLPADADGTTWYELSVADSGTGIADDIMPHIFEPFFTTHRQAGRAAGLGPFPWPRALPTVAAARSRRPTVPKAGPCSACCCPCPSARAGARATSECLPHRIFPQGPLSGPRPLRRPQRSATPTQSLQALRTGRD